MSAYRDAIIAGEIEPNRSTPIVIVPKEKAQDNFWTAVKWVGAAVTLIVGYREAKSLYKTYLHRQDEEEAAEEAITDEMKGE